MKPRFPFGCPACQYLGEDGDYSLFFCLDNREHYWGPEDEPFVVPVNATGNRWSMPISERSYFLSYPQRRARVLAVGRRLLSKCVLDRRVT
jgi:hypothetical protein